YGLALKSRMRVRIGLGILRVILPPPSSLQRLQCLAIAFPFLAFLSGFFLPPTPNSISPDEGTPGTKFPATLRGENFTDSDSDATILIDGQKATDDATRPIGL